MKNLKIKYKLVFVILSLLIALGSVLTTFALYVDYRNGVEHYKKTGLLIIKNSEYYVAHFIYLNDYVELNRLLNTISSANYEVAYAFALDSDNKVISHTFQNGFPLDLLKFNLAAKEKIEFIKMGDQSIYDFSYPINQGKLGVLRIGISNETLIAELKSQFYMHLLLLFVVIIVAAFFTFYIGHLFTKPLIKLIELTKRVTFGDFEQVSEVKSKDEIGILSESFNSMCYSLKILTHELEKSIDELNLKKSEFEALYEEYYKQNEELSDNFNKIQSINNELNLALEKAAECDRLKTAFLANLSHEIRTPMNGIMGFANLLKSPDISSDQKNKYIQIIEKSGKRMLNIIHNLVDISMIEAGQINLLLEETPINTIIDELYTFFSLQAKTKGIKIYAEKGLSFENSMILADRDKITQILSNLINNALKFTTAGQIKFGYSLSDTNLDFYTIDTGIGVPSDMIDLIFERFRQVDDSHALGFEGSGLGLSISKAFVELHGGSIWVNSTPGKGSEFRFTIPYKTLNAKSKAANETNDNTNKSKIPKNLSVLIAEDDKTSNLFLKEILQEFGYRLFFAKNGIEAVETIKKNPTIDLVLMDIKMPVMDGIEATRQIKSLNPTIPVIMQSAFVHIFSKQDAEHAGCDDYICKPLNKSIVEKVITKYFSMVK